MMRLVFLLYAEEQRLLPVSSDLYATAYSVTGLHDQLDAEQNLYGDEIGDRRAAAWPRLLATFAAVYEGCEYDEMRIPPYGGSLFDPARYPWLERLAVTDRVVHEILGALLILQRRGGAAERLSYKGLDVEQIGHVYEGLLEFSCLRVDEPYLGLIGKLEPELPLAQVEQAAERRRLLRVAGQDLRCQPGGTAQGHGQCDRGSGDAARRLRQRRGPGRSGCGRCAACSAVTCAACPPCSRLGRWSSPRSATAGPPAPTTRRASWPRRSSSTPSPRSATPPAPPTAPSPADWQARPAAELLELKVLDPAMGSGAFLVSACRYLAERLVEAWERDGYPDAVLAALGPDFDRDDAALEARRRVAARCLCGVDRDEAAVELGKLSLWLVTLAKDQPFSFLDHALRCGDSLVGLISESQVDGLPSRPGNRPLQSTHGSPARSTRSPGRS